MRQRKGDVEPEIVRGEICATMERERGEGRGKRPEQKGKRRLKMVGAGKLSPPPHSADPALGPDSPPESRHGSEQGQ